MPITVKRPVETTAPAPSPAPLKKKVANQPARLDIPLWEHESIETILNVTLSVSRVLCLLSREWNVTRIPVVERVEREGRGERVSDYLVETFGC